MVKDVFDLEAINLLSRYRIFSLKRLSVSIGKIKILSLLLIPFYGGRGVLTNIDCVGLASGELIHRTNIMLY